MRYSGALGVSEQAEVSPGVWEEVITEVPVLGRVEQRTEVLDGGDTILPKYRTTTSISVLSRVMNHSEIRYVTFMGQRWVIASMVTNFPEITVYIGEEYHGPTPA